MEFRGSIGNGGPRPGTAGARSDLIRLPRSEAPRVSIVIPSAADPQLLFACLRSLERHLPDSIPTETVVVLDGAPEGAAARVEAAAPGARVVSSSVRLGLARSGNRGRRAARGEFLALLHDDSEIEAGWLEALVAAAHAHPGAGTVGGLVLFPDGTLQTAGVILWRDGATSPPWAGAPPRPDAFDRPRAVDFCGSSALLVRVAAWDAAGGLDVRFFPAYFVDADLAMGLREAGWSVLFEPRARSRHRRGASSRKQFRDWVSARNRASFVTKWGKAIAAQEPWDGGSPESVERALAGAEERARLLASGPRRAAKPPAGAETSEQPDERGALEQDLALHREYARHLEAESEAMSGLLWWRIYRRLLPVLRPLNAALRSFRRPGSSSRTG